MSVGQKLLLVSEVQHTALGVGALLARNGFDYERLEHCGRAAHCLQVHNPDAVLVDCPDGCPPGGVDALHILLDRAEEEGISCLILHDGPRGQIGVLPQWAQQVTRHASADELWGRLDAMWHMGGLVQRTQRQMRDVRRLGEHINREFDAQSQDMRLASCLQQKFLPRGLPDVPEVHFAAVYRPAAWVSGDIYDVARVDEDHIALYIADCVGHGVAASLLTIFVKRVMSSKDIRGGSYALLSPSETLARLNEALVEADLEMSQFVTATCCLLNLRDYSMQVARAGHPYPVLVDVRGTLMQLSSGGPLLGLCPGQQFESYSLTLERGSKLVLFSDGFEEAFDDAQAASSQQRAYLRVLEEFASLPAAQLADALQTRLDVQAGSLQPRDDVTLLVLEVPV